MDCAVYYSSKHIVRCFTTHLNNDKQTNLIVPQLSVRVRKCLTHAREHVWGINVVVSVSANINKRGSYVPGSTKRVGYLARWRLRARWPFHHRPGLFMHVCVWKPVHWRLKRLFPYISTSSAHFKVLRENEVTTESVFITAWCWLGSLTDWTSTLSVTKSLDTRFLHTLSHQRIAK